MIDRLGEWADSRGYKVAWGPAEAARNALTAILSRRKSGEFNDGFFKRELESLLDAEELEGDFTVVMVAIPRPAHRVAFDLGEKRLETLLPPTYFRYRPVFEDVRQDLATNALPGFQVEHLMAPLKTMAASLGLVRYGRNNITYSEGIGSYLQLCAFRTDAHLPVDRDESITLPALLPECEGCTKCHAACPTNAIEEDRVLLHAERCITLANEHPGQWPDAIPPRAHHCLLGCLICQRTCPANPKLTIVDSGVCFSRDETSALLDECDSSDAHTENGVRAKLAWLGQPYAESVLGRNLRALVDARMARKPEPSVTVSSAPS